MMCIKKNSLQIALVFFGFCRPPQVQISSMIWIWRLFQTSPSMHVHAMLDVNLCHAMMQSSYTKVSFLYSNNT